MFLKSLKLCKLEIQKMNFRIVGFIENISDFMETYSILRK